MDQLRAQSPLDATGSAFARAAAFEPPRRASALFRHAAVARLARRERLWTIEPLEGAFVSHPATRARSWRARLQAYAGRRESRGGARRADRATPPGLRRRSASAAAS